MGLPRLARGRGTYLNGLASKDVGDMPGRTDGGIAEKEVRDVRLFMVARNFRLNSPQNVIKTPFFGHYVWVSVDTAPFFVVRYVVLW